MHALGLTETRMGPSPKPAPDDREGQRLRVRRWLVAALCLAGMAALALAMSARLCASPEEFLDSRSRFAEKRLFSRSGTTP